MLKDIAKLARALSPRHRRKADQAGAVLVIYAGALVAILLFTALAVDLGNIAQTKRQTQNAVDDAAVSAVGDLAGIFTNSTNYATYEQEAVSDAEQYLENNDTSVTSSDWTDPSKCPAGLFPSASIWTSTQTNCIGFFNPDNPALNQTDPTGIAVDEPTRTVNYTLGKAGGLNNQKVSSTAYASIQTAGSSATLPFGYSTTGGTGLQCLKTSDGHGNQSGSCSGFTTGSGNFGLICSPRYVVFVDGNCASGENDLIDADLTLGLDHDLHCYGPAWAQLTPPQTPPPYCTGNPAVVDEAKPTANELTNNCAPYNNANWANPQTGQTDAIVTNGLFLGFVSGNKTLQTTADNSSTNNCGINSNASMSVSDVQFSPRLSHPDGVSATSTDTSDACPSCPNPNPTSPHLSATYNDTFGSAYTLNGVQISAYLIGSSRTDTATVTSGSATVTDSSITAADKDKQVTGTGIPLGTYVGTVNPGVSFLLSSSATSQVNVNATANGTSVTISDPTTNSLFTSCYGSSVPVPNPATDAVDTTNDGTPSGTNVWASGDTCLSTAIQAQNPDVPIFSASIEQSPRFGIVPLINTTGSGAVPIFNFYGVYLDLAFPKNGNTVGAVQAWLFPLSLIAGFDTSSSQGFGSFFGGPFVSALCDLPAGNC